MNIYGYCRVSTDRQADRESLPTQERTLKGYCLMHNYQLTETFIEAGVSGSIPLADRPQGKLLLAVLRPGDIVIVPKLDRMFRSSFDALSMLKYCQKRSIQLHMLDLGGDITDDGLGKFMLTVLSAVAEIERERIRERIKEVKRDQKARGKYLGGKIPYGYLVQDGQLIRQETSLDIFALRRQGHTIRQIAKSTGLSVGGVHTILKRVVY